ncbi:MAG: metallophosphoesterase [Promethearchaeota archaeon]
MKIAAVADIHSPRFYTEFKDSLKQCESPDAFLLAGDIVNRGLVNEYIRVVDAIEKSLGAIPIVACFGNEEDSDSRHEILQVIGNRITFLDESTMVLTIKRAKLGVVGASVIPNQSLDFTKIRGFFERRAERVSQLLQDVTGKSKYSCLLLHYSPLFENQTSSQSFSWWISRAVQDAKPTVIIHGHIHDSDNLKTMICGTPIYNVALPAVGSITEFSM